MKKSISLIHIIIFVVVSFFSCHLPLEVPENKHDNIWDKNNPNHKNYDIEFISGPENNATIDTSQVTFRWQAAGLAQSDESTRYRYRWDQSTWVDTADTFSTGRWLSEEFHLFEVQSYSTKFTGQKSPIYSRAFYVDAVRGNSLMLSPQHLEIESGKLKSVQIRAEEVDSIMGVELYLIYNPSSIQISSITAGDFFGEIDGNNLFISEMSDSTIHVISIKVGGSEPSVSGSGVIAKFWIRGEDRNSTVISFSGKSQYYDQHGASVQVRERVTQTVIIQ